MLWMYVSVISITDEGHLADTHTKLEASLAAELEISFEGCYRSAIANGTSCETIMLVSLMLNCC